MEGIIGFVLHLSQKVATPTEGFCFSVAVTQKMGRRLFFDTVFSFACL